MKKVVVMDSIPCMVHFYYEVEVKDDATSSDALQTYADQQYRYVGHEVGDNIEWAGTGELDVVSSYDPSSLCLDGEEKDDENR